MRLKDNMIKMSDTFVKADSKELEIKVQAEIEESTPVEESEIIEKNVVAKPKRKKTTTD